MEYVYNIVEQVNIAQLIATSVIVWFFYSRLERKIEKLDNKVDKIGDKLDNVDRRLCRLEGAFSAKEC